MFIRLLKTDLKRILTLLPSVLISIIIIGTILFTAAFLSNRLLYNEETEEPIDVGIVMYISSDYSEAAYNMVANMESYSSYCSIKEVADYDTGISMLASGEITALIVVPDNILSDINSGKNTPIQVIYEPDGTFESYILNEIFVSTSSMLTISEAAIYTGTRLAKDMQLPEETVQTVNRDLNILMADYVLSRTDIFKSSEIYVTGAYSVTEHYMAAAIILITFLSGIAVMSFIKGNSDSLTNMLHMRHIDNLHIFLSRLIAVFVCMCGVSVLGLTLVYVITGVSGLTVPHFTLRLILSLLVVAFFASLPAVVAGSIAGSHSSACLLLVFVILIFAYLGGLLVPENLLPEAINEICTHTPFYALNDMLCKLMYEV